MNCLVILALCFAAALAGIPDGYSHGRYAFYGRYAGKYQYLLRRQKGFSWISWKSQLNSLNDQWDGNSEGTRALSYKWAAFVLKLHMRETYRAQHLNCRLIGLERPLGYRCLAVRFLSMPFANSWHRGLNIPRGKGDSHFNKKISVWFTSSCLCYVLRHVRSIG